MNGRARGGGNSNHRWTGFLIVAGQITLALEVRWCQGPQNRPHVLACGFDEVEFHFHVSLVVSQSSGEQVGVAAHQHGLVLGDHSFHAVSVDGLEIGDVADYLLRGPFAGDGLCIHLLGGHPGHGGTELLGTSKVFGDEFRMVHGCSRIEKDDIRSYRRFVPSC